MNLMRISRDLTDSFHGTETRALRGFRPVNSER